MGMHFGILVADMEWPRLLSMLQARKKDIVIGEQVASGDEIDWEAKEKGFPLMGGQRRGKAYLLDTSFMLSGAFPDLITDIAAESGKAVVGCGAETMSGSFWCVAARGGDLLRHFYSCRTALTEPLSDGAPFPTEAEVSLESVDGEGFQKVMLHLGFEYEEWYASGQRFAVTYTAADLMNGVAPPGEGPLARARTAHESTHPLSPEDRPQIDAQLLAGDEISQSFVGKPRKDGEPPR